MPSIVRIGDICTGHGAFPPRVCDSGSSDVFINGIGAHREGDHWVTHCNPVPSCHDSVLAVGSSTVYVNGKALARIGDSVTCGSVCAEGSSNVFAG